jgi:putative DNA primase/helicase
LLNCLDGMLELPTGELREWDPKYLSRVQVPVEWDPEATCPTYEKWAREIVGDQLDDLEECVSQMLDPSHGPIKSVMLYGPSRSGKGTYLRIMRAIAGAWNCSSVTLHQLVNDHFMAARAYGKMLNSSGDISSVHLDDLSIFKMLTGEDPIEANPKYGKNFEYTNRALFAFACNTLPTVGETSGAYFQRMKPFKFDNSFAGSEDQSVEDAIMAELPGILVRLVKAWQRKAERGRYAPTRADVWDEFVKKSNRVRHWLIDHCTVHREFPPGATVPEDKATGKQELWQAFRLTLEEASDAKMGRKKFLEYLEGIDGVHEVYRLPHRNEALNISLGRVSCVTCVTFLASSSMATVCEQETQKVTHSVMGGSAKKVTQVTQPTHDLEAARLWDQLREAS